MTVEQYDDGHEINENKHFQHFRFYSFLIVSQHTEHCTIVHLFAVQ